MAYNANYLHAKPYEYGVYANRDWHYDTLDVLATIEGTAGAGYITNAQKVGMRPGDFLQVTVWTTALPNPVTPADGTTTPLTGSGSVAVFASYRVRGLNAAGAAVLTDAIAVTLVSS